MVTVRGAIDAAGIPRTEAELLLLHLLGCDRGWLFAHADDTLPDDAARSLQSLSQRRAAGEPLAYITGRREFWSLALQVSPAVLIPRPDTEILVQWALELAAANAVDAVLDLGTGSGAIALALARELPAVRVTASDASAAALAVAQANGIALATPVEWLEGSWFDPVPGRRWSLIVSNPPYIAADDPHLDRGDLPAEPAAALVAGPTGLECLTAIIAAAPAHLLASGWLLLEHGYDQGAAVRDLLRAAGFTGVVTRRDLGGRDRVSGGWFAHG